jgi:hypothetical protein
VVSILAPLPEPSDGGPRDESVDTGWPPLPPPADGPRHFRRSGDGERERR